MKTKFILICLLFCAMPGQAGQTVFGRDGVQAALMSPDGKHIALLNRVGDNDQFLIVSVAKKNTAYFRKTTSPQRIQSVAWIDDETLALQLGEDAKYQVDVQATGEVEILGMAGDSILIGGANNETVVQQALTGRKLTVAEGLSSLPDAFLVTDPMNRNLWRINIASDSIEPLAYPPFQLHGFFASPNAKYMTANGMNAAGEMSAMVWSDTGDRGWRELHGNPEFVAVSDAGIAFAIMDSGSGIAGLVSVEIESGEMTVLFQDESSAVDQVMLDSTMRPLAVRTVPGVPEWFYLDHAHRSTQIHKALRAATPHADYSVISSSNNGATIIVKQTDDDNPSSFLVFDTVAGRSDRLLESKSGLSIVGGIEDDTYMLQPVNFESESGAALSGYISLPKESLNRAKPTVVLLRDRSDNSRWPWEFDEETWFFHRQGFNVLMLHGNPTPENIKIYDVEDAYHWLVEQDLAVEDQVCLIGRGSGAELALLTALHSDDFDCAISLGGTFEHNDLLMETGRNNAGNNSRLNALLIFGTDDNSAAMAAQDELRSTLAALEVSVDTMPVEGERRMFSSRQNEVRAYARISSFLGDYLEGTSAWPTLPLTNEQAVTMNELQNAMVERMEEGEYDGKQWQRWFKKNDDAVRQSLFAEQLPLFESYQAKVFEMADGDIGAIWDAHRPMNSIRQ
jgi:dipeptidyl aminopeptidase/acylaminoacyl peptidase